MKKLLLALLLAVMTAISPPALAQQAVRQSGNVTPGHVPMWTTTGVIQDGGTAVQGFLTSLGVTAQGPGICQNSAAITGPYNQLCLSVSTGSAARITLQNYGGAAAQPLQLVINGTTYTFPFAATPSDTASFATRAEAISASISAAVGNVVLNGYSSVGDSPPALYVRVSTPSPAKAWNFQSADGQWWELRADPLWVGQLGVKCDNITDDTAAFATVAGYINYRGAGSVWFPENKTCQVWPQSGGTPGALATILFFSGSSSVDVHFNGSTLATNNLFTAQPAQIYVIRFLNALDWKVDGFNYQQTAYTTLDFTKGAIGIIHGDGTHRGVVTNYRQVGGIGAIFEDYNQVLPFPGRLSQPTEIFIQNMSTDTVYYGVECRDSYRLTVLNMNTNNTGRSVFLNNCKQAYIDLESAGGGPFDDMLIKTYANPTATAAQNGVESVHVRYRNSARVNASSAEALLSVEFSQIVASPVVSGAVNNGSGKCRLTVNSTVDMASAQIWNASAVGGATTCNGKSAVTVIDSTTVDFTDLTFSGAYTSGGILGVPTSIDNLTVEMNVNADANGQTAGVRTVKFNSDGTIDTAQRGYSINNFLISGSFLNYNTGVHAFDLFDPTQGGWAGENIRNVVIGPLVTNGSSSAATIDGVGIAQNLTLTSIASNINWTLTNVPAGKLHANALDFTGTFSLNGVSVAAQDVVSGIYGFVTPFPINGKADAQGGIVNITGGTSSTSANAGGAVAITGGLPGATGAGGNASVVGGRGGVTSGTGGIVGIAGGTGGATDSKGGFVSIAGGTGGASNGSGGDLNLAAGAPVGTGKSGVIRTTSIGPFVINQQTPAAYTTSTTITASDLFVNRILTGNQGSGATAAYAMPTGSDIDAAQPSLLANDGYDFTIINISTAAAEIITLTANTNVTLVGNMTIAANSSTTTISSATFRLRRTGTATYIVYRVS